MPRQSRYIVPEVAAHIIQRGNNRIACFREDSDYLTYLFHLRQLAAKLSVKVHAYCLMTNHIHLLLTPGSSQDCIALMRDLGQRYVQYFNRRYERSGTLWEGRYRSCITESARYVLACYRYIELNPVRARMVQRPREYPWSSHAANIGELADAGIVPHAEFDALGCDNITRRTAYRALFEDGLADSLVSAIREATNGGYPLGSERFTSVIAASGRRIRPGRPGPQRPAVIDKNSGSDPELF